MDRFTVHLVPGSPYARAVLVALEEKGAPYQVAGIAPSGLRKPEYLARQPFGKFPVVEHGDFTLYETQAVLRYIDRLLPEPALTPGDIRRAARMDQVMNINDHYLFRGVSNVVVFQRVVGPKIMGIVPDEAAIATVIEPGHVVFGELARLLGDQPYMAGAELSLADVLLAPQVDLYTGLPEWEVLIAPHSGLVAWLARMQARASMRATSWERVAAMVA